MTKDKTSSFSWGRNVRYCYH